jgi:hypothetical protein
MQKRLTICVLLAIPAFVGVPARAEWDWYAGDITRYTSRNTAAVIPERVQTGIDAGLDWLVLWGHFSEGIFIGLRDIIQEFDLNTPRITPILSYGFPVHGGRR